MPIDDDALGELLDALEIGLELNSAGPSIEPLLDALIGAAPEAALRQAAVDAVGALWDAELEREVRAELQTFRGHAVEENARLVPTIDSALAELGGPQNHVAHASSGARRPCSCAAPVATGSGWPSSSRRSKTRHMPGAGA